MGLIHAAASATSAATFTYKLGKSIYIPLTSFCNTKTLPETRGPNFTLPSHVIQALLNVRQAEFIKSDSLQIHNRKSYYPTQENQLPFRTCQEYRKENLYPPSTIQPLLQIMEDMYDDNHHQQSLRQEKEDEIVGGLAMYLCSIFLQYENYDDYTCFPSRRILLQQVQAEMKSSQQDPTETTKSITNNDNIDCIVMGGEGEPLLRYPDILFLSLAIREAYPTIPIRIQTNGYISISTQQQGHPHSLLKLFKLVGVTHFTITLPTTSSSLYIHLMDPSVTPIRIITCEKEQLTSTTTASALEAVCTFIQQCIMEGFHVEVTSIDRPDVDKETVETLARDLGVVHPVRWRTYHP